MTPKIRDTHLLEHDELMSATGRLASVATYKTRRPGATWTYGTMIIGYSPEGKANRALAFQWSDEGVARAEHRGLCLAIFKEQGTHTLQ